MMQMDDLMARYMKAFKNATIATLGKYQKVANWQANEIELRRVHAVNRARLYGQRQPLEAEAVISPA